MNVQLCKLKVATKTKAYFLTSTLIDGLRKDPEKKRDDLPDKLADEAAALAAVTAIEDVRVPAKRSRHS